MEKLTSNELKKINGGFWQYTPQGMLIAGGIEAYRHSDQIAKGFKKGRKNY
ncbi:hypothetical protein [Staphylococcus equorum]|uniref:hypothetical protein n=1 Tax=Staphylococcus equorum TaxID=246432 RepID=UPI000396347D|nr:hypothetical protein [Staphylococcus equorum]ERH33966.1 hypothetical protein SEQU_13225 [Staphylococcus equorum UMC-CNS-924]